MSRIMRTTIVGLILVSLMLLGTQGTAQTGPLPRELTLVNSEVDGVVMWPPSVIVVHPGDRVVLHLYNTLAAVHGLNIDDYDIHAVA